MSAAGRGGILVLGIGNLLWADEGFGVRCVEALQQRWCLPDDVTVMDGGTQGLYLLPYVQAAARLLVFDAVDYGLAPGTLIEVRDAEVPKFTGAKKMSLHQTGFQEVLSAADLLGGAPPEILLVGVQAEELEQWGGSLSATVAARVDPALARAEAELRRWDVPLEPRSRVAEPLLRHGLDRGRYERRAGTAGSA